MSLKFVVPTRILEQESSPPFLMAACRPNSQGQQTLAGTLNWTAATMVTQTTGTAQEVQGVKVSQRVHNVAAPLPSPPHSLFPDL